LSGFFVEHYVPSLLKPVMIVGLRGYTDLGYQCAKRFVKNFGARRFAEYYNEWFPDLVFVDDNGICRLPRWLLHESSLAVPNVVVLSGVTRVATDDPAAHYSTFNELVEFADRLGVQTIYVLDGLVAEDGEEGIVQVAATSSELIEKARLLGAQVLKEVALPPAPSMLLGLSHLHSLKAMLVVASMPEPRSSDADVDVLLHFLKRVAGIKAEA
jgi:proteasome assembly chaperone (PAC2) family protein